MLEVVNDRGYPIEFAPMDDRSRCGEVWKLLLEVLGEERSRLPAIAAELGLSAAQCEVLRRLDESTPMAMCRLAEALDCDPSNVTGIVDRLEARGLVERCADRADRRVKNLVLTTRGRQQRERLLARLAEPPPPIRALSAADQEELYGILRRAAARAKRRL
jgi:MarR family transcriptional regulator, organic hydroperoxide resistance regulator